MSCGWIKLCTASFVGPLTTFERRVRALCLCRHGGWRLAVLSGLTPSPQRVKLLKSLNKFVSIEAAAMRHSRVDVRWCRPAEVSYVPQEAVVRPGENVTVFCVINDHSVNASSAVWRLNMNQTIERSQYRAVNQRVRRPAQLPVWFTASPNVLCSTSCLGKKKMFATGEPDHGAFLREQAGLHAAVPAWHPVQPDLCTRWVHASLRDINAHLVISK